MMARGYDRYMLLVGAGNNRKFARLTDSERCAHFLGVLSVAAQSPLRGYLMVSETQEAGAEEVASEARVSVKVAKATIEKLARVGVLVRDETVGAWFVHDWDEINPPPKVDRTNAERQRQFRERNAPRNGDRNGVSNGDVTPAHRSGNAKRNEPPLSPPTPPPYPPAKGEVGSEPRVTRVTRRIDQSKPPEDFPAESLPQLEAVLPILLRVYELRGGVQPQPRGVGLAMLRNPRADPVKLALRLEQWLVAGRGRNAKCGDIAARLGDWLEDEPAAGTSNVTPLPRPSGKESPSEIWRAINGPEAS